MIAFEVQEGLQMARIGKIFLHHWISNCLSCDDFISWAIWEAWKPAGRSSGRLEGHQGKVKMLKNEI